MDSKAPCMQVKCGVDNCLYNQSQMCFADALEVNPMNHKKAERSDETSCTTFIDKE